MAEPFAVGGVGVRIKCAGFAKPPPVEPGCPTPAARFAYLTDLDGPEDPGLVCSGAAAMDSFAVTAAAQAFS